jgi:hypothetical protein
MRQITGRCIVCLRHAKSNTGRGFQWLEGRGLVSALQMAAKYVQPWKLPPSPHFRPINLGLQKRRSFTPETDLTTREPRLQYQIEALNLFESLGRLVAWLKVPRCSVV